MAFLAEASCGLQIVPLELLAINRVAKYLGHAELWRTFMLALTQS